MKTPIWLLIAAMLLALLTGCQAEDIRPLPPEEPGSSLCEYDPERKVYIGSENLYMDYYVGLTGGPCLDIPVYSTFSLGEPDEVSGLLGNVRVDLFWDSYVDPESTWEEVTPVTDDVMPYYVYQAYRGGAVTALADARLGYKPYGETSDPLRGDFEALTTEDIPKFYVYNIRIHFQNMPEPEPKTAITLEKLEVAVDGQTYTSKVGGVRLLNSKDCKARANSGAKPVCGGIYAGNFSEYYSDGIVQFMRIPVVENFQGEYGYFCDVWMLDEGSELLQAYVTVMNQYGDCETVPMDGDIPTLFKGGSMYVDVIAKNPYADQLLSNIHFQIAVEWGHPIVEQTSVGPIDSAKNYCQIYTVVSKPSAGIFENYAIIFDGVNMEPYYDYYHETYQTWRKEYIN